ncbi:MAG: DNA internalization-related competence protein ComEC/Rec2 [Desulfovibrionaceae bacterium]|nr:DNA internalization-related competence protein ComEC/Rec2 [Desulfovibrionaceae bacterium]
MKDACHILSPAVPGLLPWQSYGLAFVIGVFGVRFPVPAAAALAVLWLADRSLRAGDCRLPVLALVCCAAFGFGYGFQRTVEPPASVPGWVTERTPVEVVARVDRVEPRSDDRLRLVLRDVRCLVEGGEVILPGKAVWSLRHPDYRPVPGQTVRAVLRVVPARGFGNPGSWDYGWYWQRQDVFWRAWAVGRGAPEWSGETDVFPWSVKRALRRSVADLAPDTRGGAMVLALTTGDKSRLDHATMEATRGAGLAHTLALSGLHVGFVAALGLALAWLAGRAYPPLLLSVPRPKLAVILAAPLVLVYAWLGQPSASLVRAAVMYGAWGFLLLQGRGRVLLDGLFFALLAIVFASPLSVFDLSLQMSVTAVAGIAVVLPHLRSLFAPIGSLPGRLLGWALGLLAVSVSANVALMPLVSWYFGTLSPNIVLNLAWLPVLGFAIMPLGLLGMALSCFAWTAPLAGVLLGWAAWCADGLLSLLDLTAASGLIPVFAVLRPLWPEMLGFGLLLTAVAAVLHSLRAVPVFLACAGFALLAAPHLYVLGADSRDIVRLSMLDVGLGQSLVVSVPGGHRYVIDGGGGYKHFDLGEAVVAPSLSHGRPPRVDGVFMTHPDVDHSHGLPHLLARFDCGPFYTNSMMPRGRTGERLREALARKGAEPVGLHAGESVRLDRDTVLEVLHPPADFSSRRGNERSLVLRLVRSGVPLALLTGDVEARGIDALLASGADLRAEVLVLPHHGSRSSLSPGLYAAVAPRAALCSNGYLNRYGFPHPEVAEAVGASVLSTSRHGRVDVAWDRGGGRAVRVFIP